MKEKEIKEVNDTQEVKDGVNSNGNTDNNGGKKKKVVKRKNKRLLIVGLVVIVAGLAVAGKFLVWPLIFKSAEQTEEVRITDISQLVNQTEEQQGDFVLSGVKISRMGAKNVVSAKLKYTGGGTADARVSFILRNTGNGQLQGRKYERIEGLAAGEEREIEIAIVGDFERSTAYEIGVERL